MVIHVLRLEYRENYRGPCAKIVKCLLFFCVAVGRKNTEPSTSVPIAAAMCRHCLSITTVLCHLYSHNSGWPPVCCVAEDSLELWILYLQICTTLPRLVLNSLAQDGFKLEFLLPQPLRCWNYSVYYHSQLPKLSPLFVIGFT